MYSRDFVLQRQAAIRNNRDEAKSKQEDGKKLTKNSSGSYIRMKIVAYQTDSPSTGGFPSVIKQYPNS